ncbi:hypothetical protein SODALDRAFT_153168 [Sodiomyces alkalinus F11]|uniref:Uncharacterized protein n=1 Tax=Sodiomyces alkalinus (strain CBS 110278 / VKM F-3762 / F11) TaxID=1314773 RepID=A0A3N2PX99_SODAK|nr:hypothetical protein SODALDRAFT_153168 [Sodiomyces alkalinus F11]ROT39159.1 hypothetical protein SODALDRAFT_153168 [Sodiomyces alkalinus F11]
MYLRPNSPPFLYRRFPTGLVIRPRLCRADTVVRCAFTYATKAKTYTHVYVHPPVIADARGFDEVRLARHSLQARRISLENFLLISPSWSFRWSDCYGPQWCKKEKKKKRDKRREETRKQNHIERDWGSVLLSNWVPFLAEHLTPPRRPRCRMASAVSGRCRRLTPRDQDQNSD